MIKHILFFLILAVNIFNGISQSKKIVLPDYYGEKITYSLKVGVFQVGEVLLTFTGDTLGCDAYLYCSAKSTGLVKILKDVQYTFDAYVDTSMGSAYRSTRIIREGEFTDYDEVIYDRESRADSMIVVTEDMDTLIVAKDISDILVAFFLFRRNYIKSSLKVNSVTHFNTYFVDKEWELNIKYAGKEKVETALGTANCFKFLPETEVGRYFDSTDDMSMWVTANKWLIPVKFEANLKVGTLRADIVSYKKPKK
jgi:hypothetical protein